MASNYDDRDVPNCELSDRDSRELDVHDPNLFDAANYDFYERSMGRSDGECMDGKIQKEFRTRCLRMLFKNNTFSNPNL